MLEILRQLGATVTFENGTVTGSIPVAGSATQSPVSDPNAMLVLDIANSFFAKAGGAFYTKRTYDSVNDTAFKQFNTVRDAPPTGVKWTPNGYGLVAVNAPFDYNGTPYVVSQVLTA